MSKPDIEPKPDPADPGRVWEAYMTEAGDGISELAGYLVTDNLDPSRLISFVRAGVFKTPDEGRALARAIAADFDAQTTNAWDLRSYCLIDSLHPTPHEFYGYTICPLGAVGRGAVPFLPFCRFRLAKMVAAFNRRTFSDKEREEYPDPGVCQILRDSGTVYRFLPFEFDELPL